MRTRISFTLLVGLNAGAAIAAAPPACVKSHTQLQKDGSLHFQFRTTPPDHTESEAFDTPVGEIRCTPRARILIVSHDDSAGPDWTPDTVSVIDPAAGRDLLLGHVMFWVNATYPSPDNRLLAYETWNGTHGALSAVTIIRLLDLDGDLSGARAGDVPIYPSAADAAALQASQDPDKWADAWQFKPQPASPIVWLDQRRFAFLLQDSGLDRNGNPSGAPRLHYTTVVTVELPPRAAPVTHLTVTQGLPCPNHLPDQSAEGYNAALKACLAGAMVE